MILFLDFDRALHACDNNHFREMNMTANDAQPMSQKRGLLVFSAISDGTKS